ncbi:DUF6913 domain-containing protein [Sunxiuqinia dokdonensis]|uniref:Uncharacterized protein n=1 Tax=Sunxiuqinia dokdonensis TaxID=1409788 RepID=A0A0L8V339_9BACT|nr:hypothetical protein [Sunxiuqinia dokdonensis]KOH42773.1 hypothetical protein NC99_44160 [Sunxiuqinia dokdonensis]
MSFKNQIIGWLLKREQRKLNRPVRVVNLGQVKTAGILWKADDREVFDLLTSQLKKLGIHVNSLCFSSQRGSVRGEALFSPNDISILGKIKNEEISKFIAHKFDVLIDISLSSGIEIQYLRCLSHARFKTGWSEAKPDYFDLSIDVSRRKEPSYLAEQIIHYLGELNKQAVV